MYLTRIYDLLLAPFITLSAPFMRLFRRYSSNQLPVSFSILKRMGVFPITAHYYEPLFDASKLDQQNRARNLPAVDFNIDAQTRLLVAFAKRQIQPKAFSGFDFANGSFEPGDAEIWFHIINHFKPKRIIEIGSGNSTRVARRAIAQLTSNDSNYRCDHICIEPYEASWLDDVEVTMLRSKVETLSVDFFETLDCNDILFIDSSHVIRPQGDVLYEYLNIIPRLRSGVVVHIHDIFSPRDYPIHWQQMPRLWNEQYLLEAFLSHNDAWDVLLANNLMKHSYYSTLKAACPFLELKHEPASFYIQRK